MSERLEVRVIIVGHDGRHAGKVLRFGSEEGRSDDWYRDAHQDAFAPVPPLRRSKSLAT